MQCREVHAATQKGQTGMLKQAAVNMTPQDMACLQLGPPSLTAFSGNMKMHRSLASCEPAVLQCREVHAATQKGLTGMLKQAVLNMTPQDRARLQLGPPAMVAFSGIIKLHRSLAFCDPACAAHAGSQKARDLCNFMMLKQAALNMTPQDRARLQLGRPTTGCLLRHHLICKDI